MQISVPHRIYGLFIEIFAEVYTHNETFARNGKCNFRGILSLLFSSLSINVLQKYYFQNRKGS